MDPLYTYLVPTFQKKSRASVIYQIAKKHSKLIARVVHKCKICDKDFHSFYKFRERKRKQDGAQRRSGADIVDVAHVTLMTIT